MSRKLAALVLAAVTWLAGAAHGALISVSIPVGSDDAISHPSTDNVWSVNNFPADLTSGIGWIVNPAFAPAGSSQNPSDFSRHDHIYTAPNVPDATRAVVTYGFDVPTIVSGVRIVQHFNGANTIHGEYANGGPFTSLGLALSPAGVGLHTEYGVEDFSFGNTTLAGTSFRFTVTFTTNVAGWALYRAFPLDAFGNVIGITAAVPEPSTYALMLSGLALVAFVVRRRRYSLIARQ